MGFDIIFFAGGQWARNILECLQWKICVTYVCLSSAYWEWAENQLRVSSADLFTFLWFCKRSAERAAIASPQQHVWCGFDLVYSFCLFVFFFLTVEFCQFQNDFLFIVPPYHKFCILLAANIVMLLLFTKGGIF